MANRTGTRLIVCVHCIYITLRHAIISTIHSIIIWTSTRCLAVLFSVLKCFIRFVFACCFANLVHIERSSIITNADTRSVELHSVWAGTLVNVNRIRN